MLDNLVRANGQILADYILAGLDTNPDTIDNRAFEERLRNYGREAHALTEFFGEEMQEKISSINGQLESLHFEIGMKADIMLAISLELEKCPSAKTE